MSIKFQSCRMEGSGDLLHRSNMYAADSTELQTLNCWEAKLRQIEVQIESR